VVVGALDGYNGTVFAYGQTGSGKTYTITGSAERYVDRGLIPRALSLIFSELANRSDSIYQLHFAYLEIYNEIGYDLLNPNHDTESLQDLPKVSSLFDLSRLGLLRVWLLYVWQDNAHSLLLHHFERKPPWQ
jgi:kinesin family protein 6/9